MAEGGKMDMPHFEKLNGKNYALWKLAMAQYFKVYGLRRYIDGSTAEPAKPEDLEVWDKADGKAQLAILSAIESDQLTFVSACQTAAQMWSNLKAVYERTDEASKLEANRAYHGYVYKDGSMALHIATVENLAEKCRRCGDQKSDMDIITKLLDRIPVEYSTVHVAMTLAGENRQNLDTVKRLLLSEELRLGQTIKDSGEALHVKKDKQAKNSKTAKYGQYKNKKDKQCYTCGEIGHFKHECPKRKDTKNDNRKSKQKHNDTDNNTGNACFSCIEAAMVGDKDDKVLADSGASCHMFNDMAWFTEFKKKTETLNLADEHQLNSTGRGKVAAEAWVNGRWEPVYFKDAMYLPGLRRNLISIGTAESVGAKVEINQGKMKFYLNDQLKMEARLNKNNLYEVKLRRQLTKEGNAVEADLKTWHEHLGHPCLKRMQEMASSNQLDIAIPEETKLFCEACIFGKSSKKPFKKSQHKNYLPGEFLHSDVNGPMSIATYGGNKWFATFIDNATGMTFVFFMKTKDEVFDKFKIIVNLIKTQLGREVKILRSDNGREYEWKNEVIYGRSWNRSSNNCPPYTRTKWGGRAEESHIGRISSFNVIRKRFAATVVG